MDLMRKLNGAHSSRRTSQTGSRSAGTGAEMTGWRHISTFPAEGVP